MKLYNSLTKTKEDFSPFEKNKVKMYVCGITPYDTTHLGHAFVYVFFDTLSRYFKYKKYSVEYTQNVTDIDDDILKRAKRDNQDWKQLGEFWTKKFLKDIQDIYINLPTHYVKATDAIEHIIQIVRELEEKGIAYESHGKVYFSVGLDKEYGKLSRYTQQEMIALSKERGADPDDPNKRNPLDFILWQASKSDEPSWDSPWGLGRPGWHIECSAMVRQYLGEQIDIHGGGFDLIYPHHESEIAQSEFSTGKKPFTKYWMHVAMLSYQGEKMSKSLGNLVLVSDLLKTYTPNQVRYLLLSHHYRTPWEFTFEDFSEKNKELEIIEKALLVNTRLTKHENDQSDSNSKMFEALLNDDMNIPEALKLIQRMSFKIIEDAENSRRLQSQLQQFISTLGLQF